jgi:membrane peptidoglycan carboxypeptidase
MKSHSHRHLQLVFRGLLILFAGLFLIASLSLVVLLRDYRHRAGMYELDRIADAAQRSIILDKNGEFHSYIHGENRLVVPLEKVSENFLTCLVAREDSRFWEHDGVDLRGIVRAAFTNLRSGKVEQGASTLTQQLARNTFQLGGRTYDRKLLEVFLARRIERQYDKKQILEHYVNRIYFGDGYYGVETASLGYFGKSAADLTLAEGATLAALICSPNRLAPTNNAAASKEERNLLLQRMADEGLLTEEEGAAAKAEPLHVEDRKETLRVQSDYVVDAVNRELQTLLTPEVIAAGGLRIHSTIDPDLQRTALNAAKDTIIPQKRSLTEAPRTARRISWQTTSRQRWLSWRIQTDRFVPLWEDAIMRRASTSARCWHSGRLARRSSLSCMLRRLSEGCFPAPLSMTHGSIPRSSRMCPTNGLLRIPTAGSLACNAPILDS